MKYPKYLPVNDPIGKLIDDWPLIVAGAMHFPECVASIFHFRHIFGEDEATATGFHSELGKAVLSDVLSRKRQGDAAGRVALRLMEMKSEPGVTPSLNKACFLVEGSVADETIGGKLFRPRTQDTIRQAFYAYRPVCHLWAMAIIDQKNFIKSGTDVDALRRCLGLAGLLEIALDVVFSEMDVPWNPWRVPHSFSDQDAILRVPGLSDNLRNLLLSYRVEPR